MRYLPPIVLIVWAISIVALAACTARESGEHDGDGEHAENSESNEFGEESGTQLTLHETFDDVRAGARLVLSFDLTAAVFTGTVQNTTTTVLNRVRVEVHLSNGTELGPTTPVDLAPGESADVNLSAVGESFTTWSAHPEVG